MIEHKQVIISHIKRLNNINSDQRAELTDHYLTSYESKLENEISSIDALIATLDEIQALKLATPPNYKMYLYAALLVVTLAGLIWTAEQSEELIPALDSTEITTLSTWPITQKLPEVSACYGNRLHPIFKKYKHHNGIDIKAQNGDKIIAPSGGVIIELGYNKRQGNYIVMAHDDRYSTRYFHLSKIAVELDQEVSQGETIGQVGNTGLSTTPHLHFEILECGLPVDPMLFLAP